MHADEPGLPGDDRSQRGKNLTVVLLENGVYEVTGGQSTRGDAAQVDFIAAAQAAGFPSVLRFADLDAWRSGAAAALAQPGPRFLVLDVARVTDYELTSPGSMAARIQAFRQAVGVT